MVIFSNTYLLHLIKNSLNVIRLSRCLAQLASNKFYITGTYDSEMQMLHQNGITQKNDVNVKMRDKYERQGHRYGGGHDRLNMCVS